MSLMNRVNRQSLVGSILCGLNEQNVLTAPLETITKVLQSVLSLSKFYFIASITFGVIISNTNPSNTYYA